MFANLTSFFKGNSILYFPPMWLIVCSNLWSASLLYSFLVVEFFFGSALAHILQQLSVQARFYSKWLDFCCWDYLSGVCEGKIVYSQSAPIFCLLRFLGIEYDGVLWMHRRAGWAQIYQQMLQLRGGAETGCYLKLDIKHFHKVSHSMVVQFSTMRDLLFGVMILNSVRFSSFSGKSSQL